MFDDKSRYAKAEQYTVTDSRGRTVSVVASPDPKNESIVGYHVLKQGQRPDHLASVYLGNAAGFWRICEANGTMLPESLSEQAEIAIPKK